jgi:tripartite-type tricarboxylate transporter receptor subunit TctC
MPSRAATCLAALALSAATLAQDDPTRAITLIVPDQGTGPMAQAALGGQIMVFIESPTIPTTNSLPVLAVFSRERLTAFPDAPTLAEVGVPIAGASHGGLVAPDGLPDAIAARLEAACETGVKSETFRTAAARLAAVARFMPGAQFRDRFVAESEANKGTIAALGLARE